MKSTNHKATTTPGAVCWDFTRDECCRALFALAYNRPPTPDEQARLHIPGWDPAAELKYWTLTVTDKEATSPVAR